MEVVGRGSSSDDTSPQLWRISHVAADLMQRVGLGGAFSQTAITLAQLTPSKLYRFELVKASMQSILSIGASGSSGGGRDVNAIHNGDRTLQDNSVDIVVVPAPILLLDEWHCANGARRH
jgi:hypothetical protein